MPIILLLLIPVLEITGLVVASIQFGFLHVVLWTIVTAYWGKYLMSSAPNLKEKAMKAYTQGSIGAEIGGKLITRFAAAVLLMIPGLITDSFGILLLIPFVQTGLIKCIVSAIPKGGTASFTMHNMQGKQKQRPQHKAFTDEDIIDADYTIVDEDKDTQ